MRRRGIKDRSWVLDRGYALHNGLNANLLHLASGTSYIGAHVLAVTTYQLAELPSAAPSASPLISIDTKETAV